MKREIWILIYILFGLSSLFAQGVYIKGLTGYASGLQKEYIGSETSRNSDGEITSLKDVYHSYGKGLKGGGAIGFSVSPNVALEFETGLGILGGITMEDESNFGGETVTSKEEISVRHIPILATVIISAGNNGSARPYAGAGAGIYLYSISTTFTNSQDESLAKIDDKVKLPIGFHGIIGAEFPMGEKMSFFGELRLVSLGLTQSEDELVELKDSDGNDILDNIPADDRVDKYEKDSTEETAPEVLSASNLGVFFGLKLTLD